MVLINPNVDTSVGEEGLDDFGEVRCRVGVENGED